ncbi:MAG: NADP-dependent isocitrate dehydrogenase [Alphaproteobacteria bacterium]|nr:NADP-dependent isocitrate dehydrogenase [Alphaproteobacteria bacterium]
MLKPTPITVAHGDGIGPEIMSACLKIMEAAGARLAIEKIDIGEKVYLSGVNTGIAPEAWESLRRTKVFYKAPITTPIGEGYKSLNVTIRKTLGLFANVRPCISYHPTIKTKHPVMDVVIVRENEEDLYAGIEYQQSDDVVQCLKIVSVQGCERIVRYAFDYARAQGRKRVTCFHKANIMKQADGLFREIFTRIAKEYPDIRNDQMIIDIGTAKLADKPESFDVIVTLNLYGDIISDVAAEITGSVGLGASSNIGEHVAMFEAIHGSAPDIAGQNIANPSGLLLSGVLMLVHLGQGDIATKIHNAWYKAIEDGIHTGDIYKESISSQKAGTQEFADAVIARLGQTPLKFTPASYANTGGAMAVPPIKLRRQTKQKTVGVDIFIGWTGSSPDEIGAKAKACNIDGLELMLISNRGVKVWPGGFPETLCTDHWRCRYMGKDGAEVTPEQILALQGKVVAAGLDLMKTESLRTFDGKAGFSAGQGE